MVDKALFIDTGGAKQSMQRLEMITNNLANVNTIGFRADNVVMKQASTNTQENQTRFFTKIDRSYSDFTNGAMINTGRDLDIAIEGEGFFAVQTKAGDEAYTRAGNFQLRNGFLATQSGDLVMGAAGAINIPAEAERVQINEQGAIIVKIINQTDLVTLDNIKLTKPDTTLLTKGSDGYFRLPDGDTARASDAVQVVSGTLEGSNVNPVATLTELIQISREFEFHTHLMKDFKDNASKANQILALPR